MNESDNMILVCIAEILRSNILQNIHVPPFLTLYITRLIFSLKEKEHVFVKYVALQSSKNEKNHSCLIMIEEKKSW